jgi:hypothetical protein
MRTRDQIAEYYKGRKRWDTLGFEAEVLLPYLDTEHLRPFCKEGADLSKHRAQPLTEPRVIREMKSYMEFAWGKVIDHRGISAGRSVQKMRAWLWLLGDDELVSFCDDERNYPQYGAPILRRICQKYKLPIPKGEMVDRMARGLACQAGCDMGCGR